MSASPHDGQADASRSDALVLFGVTADRIRIAEETGARAVQMAIDGLTIDKILTPAAFENAMRVLLAIGGSTNAIVHLAAIAGRLGLDIDLPAPDRMGREPPVLLDLKPSGQHYTTRQAAWPRCCAS